ncbi:MAG TPA: BlaI/MecI/CopY family transcriptional regulator [Flavilitoribacter sp.]|nr:BlaI/MecI/CopY family transcriptional regulator [Flavilitoribacter sp.]HMQ89805.1 BlaI/MecI/CopY family transcriptional regulator [Flavilitoribacter sp.]
MKDKKPTDAELEVLQILWDHGPSSVRFVNEALSRNREVVYTTTLKMMQVMTEKKGFLKRDTSERTHLYEALLSREQVRQNMFDRMLDSVFQGSPLKLVVQALGHENTSLEDLEAIKELISKLEKEKQ